MVTIKYDGRLGNNLFQYISAYIFSKKFNLNLSTEPINNGLNFGEFFKLGKCVGETSHAPYIIINNNNYLEYLNKPEIPKAHYIFSDYFQFREYIEQYENDIVDCFEPVNEKKDEVFVAYRIGDLINTRKMLPIEYYEECLRELNFNSGYITSDTPNHPNVIKLSNDFGLEIYNNSCPMSTIDYGRKFNKLILSEGSFSWWIGTLSKSEMIYYNKREIFWTGDIFANKNWIHKSHDCPWLPN